MVSNASDDLPEPERPVSTTSRSRGISRLTFLRLCSRAPRMLMARLLAPFCLRLALITSSMVGIPGARNAQGSGCHCSRLSRRTGHTAVTKLYAASLSGTHNPLPDDRRFPIVVHKASHSLAILGHRNQNIS